MLISMLIEETNGENYLLKTAHDRGFKKIDDLHILDHKQITKISSEIKHSMIAGWNLAFPRKLVSPQSQMGKFLPLNPIKNFKDSSIRLIIGTTSDEYRLWSEFEDILHKLERRQFL